jgi:transcriptional regulator with GAF, ATPase, and Fis domain
VRAKQVYAFSRLSPPPMPGAFSNLFVNTPLTRAGFLASARRMLSLAALLRSLREETVRHAVAWARRLSRAGAAAKSRNRPHPRDAILAALSSTSCRQAEIAEALGRPARVIDKWMQRLRREGVVGYRRDVGWYLVAAEPVSGAAS